MATTSFNNAFKLKNQKEADRFAEAMSIIVSPTLEKGYKTALKNEKDYRRALK